MTTDMTLKKVRLSVSNAVHSLAVLVAHDAGLFHGWMTHQGLSSRSRALCANEGETAGWR